MTMPFSIVVRLRHGRYEAGGERPANAEWPPHPARIFCALAASSCAEADWSALRWLESQPPPQVWADAVGNAPTGHIRGYVVENAISPKGGNLNWPGRNNGMRSRAFAVPATASFAIIWTQADPPADVLMRLGELARKVPYIGRSTSLAELTTSSGVPEQAEGWITYAPARLGDPGAIWQLRVPYVGYTSELEAAYRDGRRAWEVARPLPYAAAPFGPMRTDGLSVGSLAAQQGPFSDLMVWSITPPVVRIGGDMVLALASALRRAIISRVQEPVPAQVSGHDADGRQHVGFLALPDVGHQHADGHILGLALAGSPRTPRR